MDIKFTEEFPLDRFVNTANLDEVLYKFENERKLSDLPNYKKSYTLEEFLAEFPNSKEITNEVIADDNAAKKEAEYFHDTSGNVSSNR